MKLHTRTQGGTRRRAWYLAVILAVIGGFLLGPQAGPAFADDPDKPGSSQTDKKEKNCDFLHGTLKENCEKTGNGTGRADGCSNLDGQLKDLCEENSKSDDCTLEGQYKELCDDPSGSDDCDKLLGQVKENCKQGNCDLIKGPARDTCGKGKKDACALLSGSTKELCEAGTGNILGGADCKSPPIPAMPGSSSEAWTSETPKEIPVPLDPAKAKARAHIYEQYGMAGLEWHTYDLSCSGISGIAESAGAGFQNMLANWLLDSSKWWTSLSVRLQQEATGPGYMSKLDDAFGEGTRAARDAVYRPWIGISVLILGLGIVYSARRRNLPDAVQAIAWALLVMSVTSVLTNYPEKAGQLTDTAITQTVGQIQQAVAGDDDDKKDADPATSQGNLLTGSILYDNWLRGNFGSADSATAKKYGMRLLDAQALNWAESKLPQKERNIVIEAKQRQWQKIAAEIKEKDPDAYRHLTGQEGRIGTAFTTALGAIPSNLFSFMSSIVIICARLILKMIIVFLPAIAPLAIHKRMSGTVRTLAKSGVAAAVNAPLFVLAGSVNTLETRVLLSEKSHIPEWFAVVLLWIMFFILWAISKPLRKISSMASPNRSWFGDGVGVVSRGKAFAGGAVLGYAKGRWNARQIGKVVNGRGRRGQQVDDELEPELDPEAGEITRREIRRGEDEPWQEERPYEPGPAAPRGEFDHWGSGQAHWDGSQSWPPFDPRQATAPNPDEIFIPTSTPTSPSPDTDTPTTGLGGPIGTPYHPVPGGPGHHRGPGGPTGTGATPRTAEAPDEPVFADIVRQATLLREQERRRAAAEQSAQQAIAGTPSRPALPSGSVPPARSEPAHEGDRPMPFVAPEIQEGGQRVFVVYSPSNNSYDVHRDESATNSTPERTDWRNDDA
ncbi:hypothetical protein ACFV2X_47920 [Streptomyces sp. NPDC059679]|uniref:hypothetical protein n=1 Tax=Streptomyces sp. NPDC059679 TaxID=3346903 RepID=UPI003685F1DF